MSYTQGGLIEATDYNGFLADTPNANINGIWSTGSGDKGYGQTALGTVSAGGVVSAAQWAALVNTITSISNHQGTAITSRTAPVTGDLISILDAVNTDLENLTTNRGNAAEAGTEIVDFSGSVSKTTATGSGSTAWTITFTSTISFASADAARYFFNAGGRARIRFSKTSTGTVADPEWNDLANTLCGQIYISGGNTTQSIAGSSYTGTTKVGGSGTPTTLATTTGWYDLTTSDVEVYKQFADTSPYTGQFIAVNLKTNAGADQLIVTTTWTDPGGSGAGSTDAITGGTDTTSPFSTFGTAPTTLVTLIPPSTTYLSSASWGTPTIVGAVS